MAKVDDLSRSLIPLDQGSTLICVVELSRSSWPVAGMVPGVERQPFEEVGAGCIGAAAGDRAMAQ
jgi:transposase